MSRHINTFISIATEESLLDELWLALGPTFSRKKVGSWLYIWRNNYPHAQQFKYWILFRDVAERAQWKVHLYGLLNFSGLNAKEFCRSRRTIWQIENIYRCLSHNRTNRFSSCHLGPDRHSQAETGWTTIIFKQRTFAIRFIEWNIC